MLIVDTEGLGDTKSRMNHDLIIFTLAILISSRLIYYSDRVIDEDSIKKLGLSVQVSGQLPNS